MTRDEIMAMDLDQLETRANEIAAETAEASDEVLDALNEELGAIEERKAIIAEEIETRAKAIKEVVGGAGAEVEVVEEIRTETEGEKMEIRNSAEYINAFANYIKTGDDKECRALLTENASGTVPVPEIVEGYVRTAWDNEQIMALVRKSYVRGNLKVGFEISATDATVHTEGAAAVSEETLVLGVVNMVPANIKKWISVSDEAMDLAGEEFLMYIYDELTHKIAKKAADVLIGKILAASTVSTTTAVGVPAVTEATIGVGSVAKAMAQLSDEASNPVVIMNKATWGNFKAAQYAASFAADPFEGLPVVFNNTITAYSAATTGVAYAIVGDLDQGALMNFPDGEGISFKFDEMTLKKQDLIEVLGRQYVAIGVVAPNAFVKITK